MKSADTNHHNIYHPEQNILMPGDVKVFPALTDASWRYNPITEQTYHISNNRNPSISIITPTYNSAKTLGVCLESIKNQDYQGEIEIIIADGGSTDSTLEIAREYTNKIYPNPLKTGEAGKAVGLKHSKGEIIALIDSDNSDNILPTQDWLFRMTEPFQDREIAGTEPLCYSYRREDEYITRYCAMLGMNDPLCRLR